MALIGDLEQIHCALLVEVSDDIDTIGDNFSRVRVAAFLTLAHATLEAELENLYLEFFDLTIDEVGALTTALQPLIHMLRQSLRTTVDGNHGLKRKHVKALTQAVGVEYTTLADSLYTELSDLDSLGVRRGEVAHSNPLTRIEIEVSSEDARKLVTNGLVALSKLRNYLHSSRGTLIAANSPGA